MRVITLLIQTVIMGALSIACESQETIPARKNPADAELNASTSATALFAPPGYVKIWEDQFSGPSISASNWTVGSLRDQASGHIVPGAKGAHLLNDQYDGYITPEDCYIENGALVLRNQKRTYQGTDPAGTFQYTSGWIMSMHKVFFNTGYIEMKVKFPTGEKVWPALWLIPENLSWPPEWDMFEYFGNRNDPGVPKDVMGMFLATGKTWHWQAVNWYGNYINNFTTLYPADVWHTYGFEWTPTAANWYIDGALVQTILAKNTKMYPNTNFYIVLNNATRTKSPDVNTSWPNYLTIDYIELYRKP
jgi:beta-glucanase (GH16 family)